jgi:hypothetical protein
MVGPSQWSRRIGRSADRQRAATRRSLHRRQPRHRQNKHPPRKVLSENCDSRVPQFPPTLSAVTLGGLEVALVRSIRLRISGRSHSHVDALGRPACPNERGLKANTPVRLCEYSAPTPTQSMGHSAHPCAAPHSASSIVCTMLKERERSPECSSQTRVQYL